MILAPMVSRKTALKVERNQPAEVEDSLVIEEPLQININGRPFSITMRTPGEDANLVKGLLFTEGIVNLQGLGGNVELTPQEGYTDAHVSVPDIYLCEDLLEKRSLIANASCGICGKKEIADLRLDRDRLHNKQRLEASLIPRLGREMRARQGGFESTGGCHAAAVFQSDGTFITLSEDVGRHNAVDKVIGHLISSNQLDRATILQVSGRVSFEIVSKAAVANIPFLCAVSAPSSLAVDMAGAIGMTLVGFSREDRFTVYSNPQHINFDKKAHE